MFAITLLTVHLFNLGGYFFLFRYFIDRSDKALVQKLDQNEYNDNELVEIKVPLYLPYVPGRNVYERVDGEININGIYYAFVKRKISNDTLYLKCLPNTDKKKLYTALTNYGAHSHDLPGEKGKGPLVKKGIVSDECNQPPCQSGLAKAPVVLRSSGCCFIFSLYAAFAGEAYHPPETAC